MDDRPDRAAQGDRVVQRSDRERGLHVGVHRVADDATRERVFDGAVQELGERAETPLEVSMELQPKWGGFLGIDGKVIPRQG